MEESRLDTQDVRLYGTVVEQRPVVVVQRRRTRSLCTYLCAFLCLGLFLVIAAVIFFFLELTCYAPISPSRHEPRQWSDFKNQSFAVGIDLTAGYGTAAISFPNGTVLDIARADGDSHYNEVMAKLSLKASIHPTPPYYSCPNQSRDVPRQWMRYFRKLRGRPASDDVAAFADVLADLKRQIDVFLGDRDLGPLELAFFTVPYLPALYLEDLIDAAAHVNIQLLTWPGIQSGDMAEWPVFEVNTAYAGNGFNLDGSGPPSLSSDNVFAVLFTNTALTAHVAPMGVATHLYVAVGIANFSLGLSNLNRQATPSLMGTNKDAEEEEYWHQVRHALRTALESYRGRGDNLGLVLSYGEAAHDPTFAATLRDVVTAYQADPKKEVVFSSRDPMYAAARGAAMMGALCPGLPHYLSCFPDLRPRMQGW